MNKHQKEALNFIFECLETLDLFKNYIYIMKRTLLTPFKAAFRPLRFISA